MILELTLRFVLRVQPERHTVFASAYKRIRAPCVQVVGFKHIKLTTQMRFLFLLVSLALSEEFYLNERYAKSDFKLKFTLAR